MSRRWNDILQNARHTPVGCFDGVVFPNPRFKPPPLGGQISSLLFPVHCWDVARRQSRWPLAQMMSCRENRAEDHIGRAPRLAWPVPTGLGPVSGLSVLRTNPPAFSWWLFRLLRPITNNAPGEDTRPAYAAKRSPWVHASLRSLTPTVH